MIDAATAGSAGDADDGRDITADRMMMGSP